MREIKFRAWDIFQKKYVFTGFNVIGEITCFDGIGQVIGETWKERKKKQGHSCTLIAYNDFILEQYTGLKDKNGKEIYEGDILSQGDGRNFPVSYDCASFVFAGGCNLCAMAPSYWKDVAEIIGNIHENPELLENQ